MLNGRLDKLPSWGGYYLTGKGTMGDYWFVEASKSEYISFQTGGSAKYWAISKKTEKVCSIEVYGE